MIIDTILSDIKTAMKNKDAAALTALRGIHAQIKDATVNAGKELTDDAVLSCLEKAVKQRADFRLSISPMTFPHHLARVILCEQIYRAYKINEGSRYHK